MSIFGNQFSFHNSDPKIIDVLFFCSYPLASSSLPPLVFFDVYLGCHQLSAAGIHRIWMNMVHLSVQWLPEIWQLVGGQKLSKPGQFGKPTSVLNPDPKITQNLPKTNKNVQSAGFHTCFRYSYCNYLLWPCLCTPKFYPKYFYPKFLIFFLNCAHPKGWTHAYSM